MAEKLTNDQISEFRQAFSMIDKDSDGLISTDDLMGVIQTLNENATNEEENASDELKEAFKVFDRNQDGYISPDE
ncbi:calmodulin-like protein 11, partial [Tanacetum coccineum]